jgi:hypothetical protein
VANRTPREVETVFELEATMRDGTILRADAYRPAGTGPWPVLLARTPYGKRDPGTLARLDPIRAAGRGFLVVVQDCRGRFRSGGEWTPLAHEAADGYDTVAWAAGLPGADGRVGMYGPSYLGHTLWAAAAAGPPRLIAAATEFTWSDPQDGLVARGGAYELGLVTQWTLTLGVDVLERRHAEHPAELGRRLAELGRALDDLVTRTYWELPADEPLRRLGLPTPMSGRAVAAHADMQRAAVPALIVAGWFDAFLQGSLDNYIRVHDKGLPATLIVGPWSHDNQTSRIGETDFGDAADSTAVDGGASLLERELDWLVRQLRQETSEEPPVLLFVMGVNTWRRLPVWPPESVETPWYPRGDGSLSPDSPGPDAPPNAFLHIPHDPVRTHGGALLLPPEFPAGQFDQQQTEKRDDVLIYTGVPLDAPLEVIGRVLLHLTVESAALGSDWVARLCDVDPEGVSRNITDGIRRTRQAPGRDGQGPDPVEILIDLWSTAHVFLPGHRIRLQIAAGCFPRWDRNGDHAACQAVHHDPARPPRLVLPVVPTRSIFDV